MINYAYLSAYVNISFNPQRAIKILISTICVIKLDKFIEILLEFYRAARSKTQIRFIVNALFIRISYAVAALV